MIVISPQTVRNPAALETRVVPRRFFGRAMVWPRRLSGGDRWRFVFEMQALRYIIALLPFIAAIFVWEDFAMPIAQAPLLMVIAIGFFELRVLRLSDEARKELAEGPEVARALDALRFRGQAVLRRIAARREIDEGDLTLVVEQSELARIRPLTYVSIQRKNPEPEVMDLGPEDEGILQGGLFDAEFTERDLHRAAMAENEPLRTVTVDARSVSAHARLKARLADKGMADA